MITSLSYEGFVKRVFNTAKNQDPLQLADAAFYRNAVPGNDDFLLLKLGVSSAFRHFMIRMEKEKWNVPGRSKNRIDTEILSLISELMLCDSMDVINKALERGIELLSDVGQ